MLFVIYSTYATASLARRFFVHKIIRLKLAYTMFEPRRLNSAINCTNKYDKKTAFNISGCGRGSSENVGRWTENWKYRGKSVQFGDQCNRKCTTQVFNLDFGKSIWWRQVIKSGAKINAFLCHVYQWNGIYHPCHIGSAATELASKCIMVSVFADDICSFTYYVKCTSRVDSSLGSSVQLWQQPELEWKQWLSAFHQYSTYMQSFNFRSIELPEISFHEKSGNWNHPPTELGQFDTPQPQLHWGKYEEKQNKYQANKWLT